MSKMAAIVALVLGAIVVIVAGTVANHICGRQIREDWVRLEEIEGEIERNQQALAQVKEMTRHVFICGNDFVEARGKLEDAQKRLESLRGRGASASEMASALEEIRHGAEALVQMDEDAKRRTNYGAINIETINEDIVRLKQRLADLEPERDKLARVLANGQQ